MRIPDGIVFVMDPALLRRMTLAGYFKEKPTAGK
jgi:hypothetical protein